MRVGLVGPCGAGKTTFAQILRADGYEVRQIAQEHSYVKDMWRKIAKPDVLIYLDVSFPNTILRRQLNWQREEYEVQVNRLEHARLHADLYLDTDQYSIEEATIILRQFLENFPFISPPQRNLE